MERALEKKADAIAKALVRALERIEEFKGDPAMIMDSAKIESIHSYVGVKETLRVIRHHYCLTD